ncbi:DUF2470 domain-containing protein [Micromonospora sp. WMMD980]|uniref:DUF2470 domain-containing protein n=1 Tax=Micromonospora sp. WMMD980 TaxID=3016088 RepID=UPI002416BE30|nr:DUF2470 domain-containing protein [Micromonospora sp. WMMD980]MDG4800018.1 DUF2470 domain-containing protein [Micromonospora sp. WMMD980]
MALHPAGRPTDLAHPPHDTDASAADGHDAAVVARSALSAATSLRLAVDDAAVDLTASHAVLPDGTVVLAVDAMSRTGGLLVAARGRAEVVQVDVTHLIPVATRSRVRARLRILGTARPFDPASLDLCDADTVMSLLALPPVALWTVEPNRVRLTRDHDEWTVDTDAYRAARADPIAGEEAAHLHHLTGRHRDLVDQLAMLLDPALRARSARVLPVALDADGVILRAEAPQWHTDVRLAFPRRVVEGAGLAEGLRALLAEAFRAARSPDQPSRSTTSTCVCELLSG